MCRVNPDPNDSSSPFEEDDVTELLCFPRTGEEALAGGDRAIHDRDVDWLQQSDGDY